MISYGDFTPEDLSKWLEDQGERPFHAKQILKWIYEKGVLDWEEMTNLSKTLREKLAQHIRIGSLKLVRITESTDLETFKFLWQLHDGNLIESVLICSGDRRTVCVSSQVGCPAKCAFCASGQQGFARNLRPTEIIEQVVQINRWLASKEERVSHLVYMGMGEPLKNFEAVMQSIRLLTHPDLLNISQRRITVSTVGIVDGIKRLANEGLKVNLVLSLHAPNQHIRKKIIPYARQYPLEDIIAAMDEYAHKTKRDITYEYILLAGVNDHPDHAHELAHLLKGKQCTVNLIPYNPVPGVRLKRPEKKAIKDFRSVLFGCKIVNTCRYTKGNDIAAACGQLAMQEKMEQTSNPPSSNDEGLINFGRASA
jgi:23S rRNA (adenine2503-C2)-methyltransferase